MIGQKNKVNKVNGLRTVFVKEMQERRERGIRIEWINKWDRKGQRRKGRR
jgi:hypothetical protein